MIRLYSALLYLLLPAALLRLFARSLKAPGYRRRIGERFSFLPRELPSGGLWIHAVSVGEVQASAPLIQKLLQDYPHLPIVVTTTTPTGSQRLRELFGRSVSHVYAPYDAPWVVRRFVERTRPRLAVFMETEIWPNIIDQCDRRGIPTLLANARLSSRSAAGYRKVRTLTARTFARLERIAAQSKADADRFIDLGADPARVSVTGSIKFDVRLPPSLREQSAAIKRGWGADRPTWIAASTHEGEDEQILEAHRAVLQNMPDALLVLVPRHPERFDRVAQLVEKQGLKLIRRSQARDCSAETQVFLGDSMGELPMFFPAADLAFVGGSLVPHGGHNPLEPAASGVPVITGPHVFNFARITEMLLDADAALMIEDAAQLAATVVDWLTDASRRTRIGENGMCVVERNRGALERLTDLVRELLEPAAATRR